MNKEMSCRTCKYWNPPERQSDFGRRSEWGTAECRRNSPTHPENVRCAFPVTKAMDWCGQWEELLKPKEEQEIKQEYNEGEAMSTPTPSQPNWYKLNDGQWHHVVMTSDGRLYVDGKEMK